MADDLLSDSEKYATGIATAIIAFAALAGNGLIFCAFYKYRKLRTPTNYFIVNLAIFDFFVGCLPMAFWASFFLTGTPRRSSAKFDVVYWLWECFDVLCGNGSVMSLTFIAVDRYICIKDALRYHSLVTAPRVHASLVLIWLFSTITVILSYLKTAYIINGAVFRYYVFISGLIMPVCVMAFCYVNIFLETVRLNREMQRMQVLGTFSPTSGSLNNDNVKETEMDNWRRAVTPIVESDENELQQSTFVTTESNLGSGSPCERNMQKENQTGEKASNAVQVSPESKSWSWLKHSSGWGESSSRKQESIQLTITKHDRHKTHELHRNKAAELKAARTLCIIMGAFLLTWTPFIMTVMVYEWYKMPISYKWTVTVKTLHYFSSGLNPFLYTVLNKNFRQACVNLLLCRSRGRSM